MTRRFPTSSLLAVVLLALTIVSSGVRAQDRSVPAGGDPVIACGQKPDGRAYWTEYAFCDLPVRGPGQATGLILWSHGVYAKNVA